MSTSRRCSGRLKAEEVSHKAAVDTDVELDDKVEQMGCVDARAAKNSQETSDRNGTETHEAQDTYALGSSTAVTRPVKKKARLTTVSNNQESAKSDPEQIELEASEAGGESTSNSKSVKPEQKVSAPLAHFLQMPLDILAEICSHLPVETIIELCRTSKGLRSILLSRGGRSVWVAARQRNRLPKLEHHDLDEVQYAILLFGKLHCHGCLSKDKDSCPGDGKRRLDAFTIECDTCYTARPTTRVVWKPWPLCHPKTSQCIFIISYVDFVLRKHSVTYDKQEFKQVSAQLNVLEAADARETEERDSLRFRIERKNGHRTRQNDVDESELSQPHKARVRHFVEEKQRFIEDQRIEREEVKKALAAHHERLKNERLENERRQQRLQDGGEPES